MGGIGFGLHVALLIGFVAVFAWSCEEGPSGSPSGARRAPTTRVSGYNVVDVVNGGTLVGTVIWIGPLPQPAHVTVTQDADACGTSRELGALTVSPRGGVQGTVVYLEAIDEGRALPTAPVEIAFRDCELVPRVSAVPAGATIGFVHRDHAGVIHNLHATSMDGSVWADLGLAEPGATATAIAPAAGISTLVDDAAHPWIRGYVLSFSHPYYAVTDADGRFRIAGVPPGQYVVRTWHEGVRTVAGETVSGRPRPSQPLVLSRPVVAVGGSETTVDFQLDMAAVDAAGD